MSLLWAGVVFLCGCLGFFLYLSFCGTRNPKALRLQKRAFAFVILAGLFSVVAEIRQAVGALVFGGVPPAAGFLVEVPAVLCLFVAAHALLLSEKEEVAPLRRSASLDPLTALPNQSYFRRAAARRVSQAREYEMPLSLAMLDLDDFKSYNDVFGHEAGNAMLRLIAKILDRSMRADDLVARYGGEEFVVLIDSEGPGAEAVFERIRKSVAELTSPEVSERARRRMTVSIGVCGLKETNAQTAEELIEAADRALYEAKRGGKNRVVSASSQVA